MEPESVNITDLTRLHLIHGSVDSRYIVTHYLLKINESLLHIIFFTYVYTKYGGKGATSTITLVFLGAL